MTASVQPPFVSHDAGVLAGAVVLRPTNAIERLAPVHGEPSPIAERARDAHAIFVGTLRSRGVAVTELAPTLETPAESLLADTVIMLPHGAVIARPSAIDRRAETIAVEAALVALGIPIVGRIEAPGLLDATDVTLGGETLYVGVPRAGGGLRARSNELGRRQLEAYAASSGIRTIELSLDPEVVRLRSVLSFAARDTVIAASERVDTAPLAGLTVIDVPRGEEYAAGVLALGERRVLVNLRFRETFAKLKQSRISVEAIDLWEFGKAGAGPQALVLPIKRS